MFQPIFFDYNKITDDLLNIGYNTSVQIVVSLSEKRRTGELDHFHHEFSYLNDSGQERASIKRNINVYLQIVKFKEQYVIVGVNDIILMRNTLQSIEHWFQDRTFGIKNDRLYVVSKKKPKIVSGLAQGKWLQFEPVVITYEDQTQIQGIRMTLSDPSVYTDIEVNKFYGLLYFFEKVDLFGMAQNMLNYLGRPDFGSNMTSFIDGEPSRPVNNKPSFFDKK